MQRHGLSDGEWARLDPLLPPRSRKGRPPKDHRLVLDALLWLGSAILTSRSALACPSMSSSADDLSSTPVISDLVAAWVSISRASAST